MRGTAASGVEAFLGIPYLSPLGDLRWRPPQPVEPWTEARDATVFGATCAAPESNNGLRSEVEDCLFINVWRSAGTAAEARLPVYVYIHGGALLNGRSNQVDMAEMVAAAGIVGVNLNYRLGALDFLAHPALTAELGESGNWGLMDQQAALRWVRDNIAAFGGDPARVTVGGESAGGWSVCAHLVAPESSGLFAGAILQSGGCPSQPLAEAEACGRATAQLMQCPDDMACLRALPVGQLIDRAFTGTTPLPTHGTAFPPDPPCEAIAAGVFAEVPILVGATRDEGRYFQQSAIGWIEGDYVAWIRENFSDRADQAWNSSGRLTDGSEDTTVPADDVTVVAVLRTAAEAPRSPELMAALRAARADAREPEAARAAARLLIDEGRVAGESRLVGAALGVLRPVMEPPEAETLYLAATARQYQHDFEGALGLLDQAVGLDPRHVNALLSRATLKMVACRLRAAQEDCALVAALRQDVGFLCQSTALIVTPQALMVSDRLSQILARPGLLPPSLEPWAVGLLGEIAMLQGDDAAARGHFEDLLAQDPDALRERLMLADFLLRTGEPGAVVPLLAEAPSTDGVLLRRALAARAGGSPDAATEAALAERVGLNLDLGLDAHAREDALYFLLIAEEPDMALDRARANWELQHEIEDAQLLIDAAVAAGRPGDAVPVLQWMDEEGVGVPALRIPENVREAAR